MTDAELRTRTGADLDFLPIDDHAEALEQDVASWRPRRSSPKAPVRRRPALRPRERDRARAEPLGSPELSRPLGSPVRPVTREECDVQCSDISTRSLETCLAGGWPSAGVNPDVLVHPRSRPEGAPCPATRRPGARGGASPSSPRSSPARPHAGAARSEPRRRQRRLSRQRRPAGELRRCRFLRPGRRADPQCARRRDGLDPRRPGLLDRRLRRRHLQLRRCRLLSARPGPST